MKNKKVCLLILDWFGINEKNLEENSIAKANNKPLFEKLFALPDYTRLEASWRAVWIVDWFMWGSEVWHLTIWAWKIPKQSILEINDFFEKDEFKNLDLAKKMFTYLEQTRKTLHLAWMLGFEWIHSYQPHLYWLIKSIPKNINISLDLFSDWRDSPQKDSYNYLKEVLEFIKDYPNVQITSLSWRYFAMDRDNNLERTEKTYNAILWKNITNLTPLELLEENYKKWIFDEFIEPVNFWWKFEKWDIFLHFNFRSDRWAQLTRFFEQKFSWDFVYTMTKFYWDFTGNFFLNKQNITNTLSEVLQKNWLTQLHLAETEKFAHVTKFFNWLRNWKIEWEEHILVPSHKIEWLYDKDPEMSAFEILEEFRKNSSKFDFYVVNLANWDLVWHSWVLEAWAIAVETLDKVTSEFIKICDENSIDLLITADHGNCEQMWTKEAPCNSHTTNLVPFWYISNWEVIKTKPIWWLANIAPTVLEIMWIEKPVDMFESLIID